MLGPYVEKLYGSARFVVFWILTGIAGVVASYLAVRPEWARGALGQFLFRPYDAPSAGASGALFGLMGVLFVFGIKYPARAARWLEARLRDGAAADAPHQPLYRLRGARLHRQRGAPRRTPVGDGAGAPRRLQAAGGARRRGARVARGAVRLPRARRRRASRWSRATSTRRRRGSRICRSARGLWGASRPSSPTSNPSTPGAARSRVTWARARRPRSRPPPRSWKRRRRLSPDADVLREDLKTLVVRARDTAGDRSLKEGELRARTEQLGADFLAWARALRPVGRERGASRLRRQHPEAGAARGRGEVVGF